MKKMIIFAGIVFTFINCLNTVNSNAEIVLQKPSKPRVVSVQEIKEMNLAFEKEKSTNVIPLYANISYYCPCEKCCGKSDGITASGTIATEGKTIAMGKKYPFGTKVNIDGNIYVVEDRRGTIKGNKIDIFVNNHQKALQLGRCEKNVLIIEGE